MIRIVGTGGTARRLRVACRGIAGNLVVVWGDAEPADVADGVRIVNGGTKLGAIRQLEALGDAGIATVQWTTNVTQARGWVRLGHTVWGRNRTHTQGRDIVGTESAEWGLRDFWVICEPNVVSEWRIHVWDGHTIGQGMKDRELGYADTSDLGGVVRSRRNGWHIRHDREVPKGVRPAAVAACEAVGYDFGAVDVLYTRNGPVVLEVNSAPAVRDEYTIGRYLGAITAAAGGGGRI